jgi:hypothetical protein
MMLLLSAEKLLSAEQFTELQTVLFRSYQNLRKFLHITSRHYLRLEHKKKGAVLFV